MEAKEIQENWKPKVGDWVVGKTGENKGLVYLVVNVDPFEIADTTTSSRYYLDEAVKKELFWLPTQKDYQLMIWRSLPRDERASPNMAIVILEWLKLVDNVGD